MSTQSRINKGIQALRSSGDENWHIRVNMNDVTPETGLTKILTQIFGSYEEGYQRLDFKGQRDLQKSGFATTQSLSTEQGKLEFGALHRRWCKAIDEKTA